MEKRSAAWTVARIAICAALYAVVNGLTAPIGTPWGVGQFRPGVIIPALFAITSGTLVAAVGAGLGSFVGDVIFLVPAGQTNVVLALAAGLPGNFIGFLVFGYIVNRMKSWSAFAVGSVISLLIGNMVAAIGVMAFFEPLRTESATAFWVGVFGFTLFWEFTMMPFMILLLPILLRSLYGMNSTSIWPSGPQRWKPEPLYRVAAAAAVASIPFFVAGGLSYLGYFDAAYGAWPLLGPVLGPVMTLFELGIAVTILFSPAAPLLAGSAK